MCEVPAATAVIVLPASTPVVLTATGTPLLALLLLPNWPLKFLPHAATVPSEHSTRVWPPPAAIDTTVLPESTPVVSTNTGTELLLLPLWPSSPLPLLPHAATVPSEHSARQWS